MFDLPVISDNPSSCWITICF